MAAPHRPRAAAVSEGRVKRVAAPADEEGRARDDLASLGFLSFLRSLERRAKGKPRIGKNATMREEIVTTGQDPFLAFPVNDMSEVVERPGKPVRLRSHILGFFGPHGALPINTTEEVYRWVRAGDDAFVRFTDIFAARFQQLFYRAWADSRAITQFDHEDGDRFTRYLGALGGVATPAFFERDSLDDVTRLTLISLYSGRVKSPVRLRQMIEAYLGDRLRVGVEEHVPSWLVMEPSSENRLGMANSALGRDMHLGNRVQSVNDKIRLHIRTETLAAYRRLLPGGEDHARLRDIVHWYLGKAFEIEIALALPAGEVPAAQIGASAELGYMACVAPAREAAANDNYIISATFLLRPEAAARKAA